MCSTEQWLGASDENNSQKLTKGSGPFVKIKILLQPLWKQNVIKLYVFIKINNIV